MIKQYKKYTDIIISVMQSKGMHLVGTDSIGYDNYHYFAFENNPLELNADFFIEFEHDSDKPINIQFWFETSTGNPDITDLVHDNKEYSFSVTLWDDKSKQKLMSVKEFKTQIEKDFERINSLAKTIVAPMLCRDILIYTSEEQEKFKKDYKNLITTPKQLETLFEYADMTKEYNEWVMSIMIDELLPSTVKDIFIF